uniref:Uncharacterized protein n=1 Tax=Sphenodon punctatus TaxID=8508 RepID=A0A8D0L5L3_SPHPU
SSFKIAAGGPRGIFHEKEEGDNNSAGPKRKTLPPLYKLGPAPQKPGRHPNLDLERFQKGPNKGAFKQVLSHAVPSPPVPPPSHSVTQTPPLPPALHPTAQQPPLPTLPPRNIKTSPDTTSLDNDDNYDDVELGSEDHGNADGSQEDDGETYEDIDEMKNIAKEKEKKRGKEEKEKRDQEKKQKEKNKKEQEIMKKFKVWPLNSRQHKECIHFYLAV